MKVTQHLWLEKDMEAAVRFYASLIPLRGPLGFGAARRQPERADRAKARRVTAAMLKMVKLDIAELEAAARG
jgi:predicted 3-demethylubiquinone-9 3-methyltransferase (glyoxalase superfamily)